VGVGVGVGVVRFCLTFVCALLYEFPRRKPG